MTKITFIERDGDAKTVTADEGLSLLQVAHENDIDLEGACGGCMSCATCHVVVDETCFEKLTPATADEEDTLDLAYAVEPTSRLCCQIRVEESLDGLIVRLPVE